MPEARADHRPRLDVPGALLAAGGMLSLLVGITRIEHDGPAATSTIAALLIGAALLGAFVAWERHRPSPLLRLGLLRIDSLRSATFGAAVNAIAFTALVYMGTLYLQAVLGYRPLEAALALAPVDIVAFAVPLLASGAIARRSPRLVLTAAFGLTAVALTWLARTPVPADYVPDVMAPLLVLGASLSVAFVVLTNESIADVSHDEKGIASGVFETANHLFGGAIGVALYATVVAAAGSGLDDAGGYRAGFLTAAALAALGIVAARGARSGRPSRPAPV